MVPKGKLIAIGGAETKNAETPEKLEVLRQILHEMKNKETVIEIIPTASQIPTRIGKEYVEAFRHLGCKSANVMMIRGRNDVSRREFIQRIKDADGIMLSGGDQTKLTAALFGSEILEILKHRYLNEPEFVIAGTSAGAMAQSGKMINGGTPIEAVKRGKAMVMEGLGFINNAIIDSHFINRGRFGRLMLAVAEYPQLTGIGISEDTGVIITEERYLDVIGSSQVILIEGSEIGYNSLHEKNSASLNIERMCFHLLSRGMRYDMVENKFVVKELA
ncbi:MAG: cyanophycinase [Chitinophagales bacterium]